MTGGKSIVTESGNMLSSFRIVYASMGPATRGRQATLDMTMSHPMEADSLDPDTFGPTELWIFTRRIRAATAEAITEGRRKAASELMRAATNPGAPDVPSHTRRAMESMLARTLRVTDIFLAGATRRYAVEGVYPETLTPWSGHVHAACPLEAAFRGAMDMAADMVGHDQPYGRKLARADGMTITGVMAAPAAASDYRTVLADILAEARDNNYRSPAIERAEGLLCSNGGRPGERLPVEGDLRYASDTNTPSP